MASRRLRLPVGGGDSIVIWRSVTGWVALFAGLVGLFVLAMIVAYQAQPTRSRKVTGVVFFGCLIVLFALGMLWIVRHRSRLQISADTILFVSDTDHTLTLYRQSGTELRIVNTGPASRPRPGLTNGEAQMILPISHYSTGKIREACLARGWELTRLQAACGLSGGTGTYAPELTRSTQN